MNKKLLNKQSLCFFYTMIVSGLEWAANLTIIIHNSLLATHN